MENPHGGERATWHTIFKENDLDFLYRFRCVHAQPFCLLDEAMRMCMLPRPTGARGTSMFPSKTIHETILATFRTMIRKGL